MEETLKNAINEVLAESDKESIDTLSRDMKLVEDLKFDSIMLAYLTVKLEDETGIDVFEEGIVYTIEDILYKLGEK